MKEKNICKVFYSYISNIQKMNGFKSDFMLFHIPNEQNNNMLYTIELKRMGLVSGVPDYCILLPNGKVSFIEFKRNKSSKLTASQLAFKVRCETLSIPYFVCYTVDEGYNALQSVLNQT